MLIDNDGMNDKMAKKMVIIGTIFIAAAVLLMSSTINQFFKSIGPNPTLNLDKIDVENTLVVEIATISFGVVLIVISKSQQVSK